VAGEAPSGETDRKVDVLAEELAKLKDEIIVPETAEMTSEHGLGPAASKVYRIDRGLSIGGYGEGHFSETVSDTRGSNDTADALRLVLYTGYKFSDRILFNSEIEFEHATTSSTVTSGDGSVSVELAYLDFLLHQMANVRTGLVLVPMGFINEIHEPVFFHGNDRPEVERRIIPSTWRELGAGVFGSLHEDLEYRAYLTTSLNAKGFSSSGIRGGRQSGNRASGESLAMTGRVDYTPSAVPGLLIGGSAFVGETGQNQNFAGSEVDALLTLWDLHAQYRWRGLELRALAVFGTIGNADTLSLDVGSPVGDRQDGHYYEVAYDVMPHVFPAADTQYLAPFFRYENFDTNASVPSGFTRDRTKDTELYTVGLTYKPIPQVALKLDYRNFELARGEATDRVTIGAGFVF
jgi:opacity protein-like surface antigen